MPNNDFLKKAYKIRFDLNDDCIRLDHYHRKADE